MHDGAMVGCLPVGDVERCLSRVAAVEDADGAGEQSQSGTCVALCASHQSGVVAATIVDDFQMEYSAVGCCFLGHLDADEAVARWSGEGVLERILHWNLERHGWHKELAFEQPHADLPFHSGPWSLRQLMKFQETLYQTNLIVEAYGHFARGEEIAA